MKTFLFYDLETSGLNKAFDQIMQFAAIRTDESFNPIEKHEFLIQLNPDIIPSPYAILTHGISVAKCNSGIKDYEAVKKIHALINQPETISIGYNSLNFDDEFLRFSFYKNLLPAYTHQYANNCYRMDLYPFSAIYFLFQNDVITWPFCDDKPSLKLENISAANSLATGKAHDAMVDVNATIALAKKFLQKREMWDYIAGYFQKETDLSRILKLPIAFANFQIGIIVDGSFGAKNLFHCPALSLGNHFHYRNQTLWLRLDDVNLPDATRENFTDKVFVIRKKLGETNLVLPFNDRFKRHLSPERLALIQNNIIFLQKNQNFLNEIANYYRNYTYPNIPDLDVDAALYQRGFLTPHEQSLCEQFQHLPLEKKADLMEKMPNNMLREQALRILGRNYFEILSERQQEEFNSFLKSSISKPIKDFRNKLKLTKKLALNEITEIKANLQINSEQKQILTEYEAWLMDNEIKKSTNAES